MLELAEDESVPLLERVRFLAIFAGNLDEFFMVRVAGLMRRMAAGLPVEGVSVQLPGQVLSRTLDLAGWLTARHAACFTERILPALSAEGIEVLRWKELSSAERGNLRELFRERIYPVLTPLVVDPAHPFPFISGLSLNLAVMVADPRTGATMFARVKVPPLLPRFLAVSPQRFVPIEDVIAAHLTQLFAGLEIIEHHAFRVTRVRDLEMDEDLTEDLLQALERELLRRRFDPAVRLEVEDSMSSDVLDRLVTELSVDRRAVYRVPGPLNLSAEHLAVPVLGHHRQIEEPEDVREELGPQLAMLLVELIGGQAHRDVIHARLAGRERRTGRLRLGRGHRSSFNRRGARSWPWPRPSPRAARGQCRAACSTGSPPPRPADRWPACPTRADRAHERSRRRRTRTRR